MKPTDAGRPGSPVPGLPVTTADTGGGGNGIRRIDLGLEPWVYCPTCDDGHRGDCPAVTPARPRKPLTLRLLDLIGRPA